MNPATFLPIIFIFMVLYFINRRRRYGAVKQIIEKRKKRGNEEMKELATKFIDKDCLIYAFDGGHQFEGVIKEVTDGAILVEKDGALEAINLDFVIRIREYPKNKKGKKASIVLD